MGTTNRELGDSNSVLFYRYLLLQRWLSPHRCRSKILRPPLGSRPRLVLRPGPIWSERYITTTGSWCSEAKHSPRGLWVGLGLSSTTDWMSGWSLTTMSGGRSLLRISVLCWLTVEILPDGSSSPSSASLSVSDASPGTWQHPEQTVKTWTWSKAGFLWRLSLANLDPWGGGLGSRHGGDVDLIVWVRLWGLALHHDLVPAGHGCTCGWFTIIETTNTSFVVRTAPAGINRLFLSFWKKYIYKQTPTSLLARVSLTGIHAAVEQPVNLNETVRNCRTFSELSGNRSHMIIKELNCCPSTNRGKVLLSHDQCRFPNRLVTISCVRLLCSAA